MEMIAAFLLNETVFIIDLLLVCMAVCVSVCLHVYFVLIKEFVFGGIIFTKFNYF